MYVGIYFFYFTKRESSFRFFPLESVTLPILSWLPSPVMKEEKYGEFIFAIRL